MSWLVHKSKIENFKVLCEWKIKEHIQEIKKRKIIIWGEECYIKIVLQELEKLGYECNFFIYFCNKQMENMNYPEFLNQVQYYVFIAMGNIYGKIEKYLDSKGYKNKDYLYLIDNERYLKEDIVYKDCLIGRYTNTYHNLLADFPIIKKIGRFCSINESAKVVINHSLDTVTTHSFLDMRLFFKKDVSEERQQ